MHNQSNTSFWLERSRTRLSEASSSQSRFSIHGLLLSYTQPSQQSMLRALCVTRRPNIIRQCSGECLPRLRPRVRLSGLSRPGSYHGSCFPVSGSSGFCSRRGPSVTHGHSTAGPWWLGLGVWVRVEGSREAVALCASKCDFARECLTQQAAVLCCSRAVLPAIAGRSTWLSG